MNPQEVLINIIVTTNGDVSASAFQRLMDRLVKAHYDALDQMRVASERAEQDYLKMLDRMAKTSRAEWDREAKAQATSAWAAEKEREKAFEAEMRALTKTLDAEQKAEERTWGAVAAFHAKTRDQEIKDADRYFKAIDKGAQQSADRQIREAYRSADENRKAMEQTALSFNSVFGANLFANLATDALQEFFSFVKDGVVDITKFAARTEELQVALDALAKTNNISTAVMDKQVQSLKDANIATQGARQVLLEFINAGLPLEKVSPLAQVSKDLAVIAGVSGTEEFQRLTHGIVTLNSRVLRTAGVYTTAKQAEEEWARARKKHTEDMTDEEKQLAVLEKVIERGQRAQGAYEASMSSTAKQLRNLERLHMDFSDAVGSRFVPIMGILVKTYTAFLIGFTQVPSAFVAATVAVAAFTIAIIAMNTAQIASLPIISQLISSLNLMWQVMTRTASLSAGWAATMAVAAAGWIALIVVILAAVAALYAYDQKQREFKRRTDEQVAALARNQREIEELTKTTDGHEKAITELGKAYDKLDILTKNHLLHTADETRKTKELREELERLSRANNFIISSEAVGRVRDVAESLAQLKDAKDRLGSLERELNTSTTAGGAFANSPDPGDLIFMLFNGKQKYLDESKEQLVQMGAIAEDSAKRAQEGFELAGQSVITMAIAIRRGNETVEEAKDRVFAMAQAHGVAKSEVDSVRQAMEGMAGAAATETASLQTLTQILEDQIDAYNQLTDAKERAKSRGTIATNMVTEITEKFVRDRGTPEDAKKFVREMATSSEKVKGFIEDEKRARAVREALEEEIGKKKERRQRHEMSELEKLTKQYAKLQEQVESYYNLTSKAFTLRFNVESLERVKREFEEILNLRQQMRLTLTEALPTVLTNPRSAAERDTQAQQIAQLHLVLEQYQRYKKVFDEVQKTMHEARDAEDQLASSRVTADLPVVGALTRAEIAYQRSLRDTRNEIQQTAASVITLTRQREEAEQKAAESTARAYLHVSEEYAKREKDLDESIRRNTVTLQALRDPAALQATVNQVVNLNDVPRVPSELQQIAKHASTIDQNVAAIAVKVAGKDLTVPDQEFNAASFLPELQRFLRENNIHTSVSAGQTRVHNKYRLDHTNAIDVGVDPGTREGRLLEAFLNGRGVPFTPITQAMINAGTKATSPHHHLGLPSHKTDHRIEVGSMRQPTGDLQGASAEEPGVLRKAWDAFFDAVQRGWQETTQSAEDYGEPVKVDSNLMKGLLDNEEARRIAVKTSQDERGKAEIQAIEETWVNEGRLHNQLIEWETDLRRFRSASAVQREKEARNVNLQLQDAKDRMGRLDRNDPDEELRTQRRLDLEHVNSRIGLRDEVRKLNNDIATSGEDAALREQVAYLKAVKEIKDAHEDAAGRVIAAQVRMADSLRYHADLDNAKVTEYLAAQTSLTDAVSDMKIGVMDATFNTIGRGLDRITQNLGPLRDLANVLKDFSIQLLRLALMPTFQRLFGLPGAPSSYSQALGFGGGGGGVGLPAFGTIPRLGPGGTPPFVAPGATGSPFSGNLFSGAGSPFSGNLFGALQGGGAASSANASFVGASPAALAALQQRALGFAPTLSAQQAQAAQAAAIIGSAGNTAGAAAGGAGAAAGIGGALGTMTPAIAAMLPLLGAQVGGSLFKDSRLASGLGMGAGLALGGAGAVALLGGSGAAVFGAGGALASLGPLAGLLTNPFTIGVAAAALVAAYFINRSAKRRREEEKRTDILLSSKAEMDKLIASAKGTNPPTIEEGRAAFLTIRQNYLDQVNQLTDKKTRNIAVATVRELDYQWTNILQPLLARGDRSRELERAIVPTFGVGGQMHGDGLAYVHHREVVLTQDQQRMVGIERIRQAVPNYQAPSNGQQTSSGLSDDALDRLRDVFSSINMTNVMVPDDDAADGLISRGSPETFYYKTKLVVAKDGGSFLNTAVKSSK